MILGSHKGITRIEIIDQKIGIDYAQGSSNLQGFIVLNGPNGTFETDYKTNTGGTANFQNLVFIDVVDPIGDGGGSVTNILFSGPITQLGNDVEIPVNMTTSYALGGGKSANGQYTADLIPQSPPTPTAVPEPGTITGSFAAFAMGVALRRKYSRKAARVEAKVAKV